MKMAHWDLEIADHTLVRVVRRLFFSPSWRLQWEEHRLVSDSVTEEFIAGVSPSINFRQEPRSTFPVRLGLTLVVGTHARFSPIVLSVVGVRTQPDNSVTTLLFRALDL